MVAAMNRLIAIETHCCSSNVCVSYVWPGVKNFVILLNEESVFNGRNNTETMGGKKKECRSGRPPLENDSQNEILLNINIRKCKTPKFIQFYFGKTKCTSPQHSHPIQHICSNIPAVTHKFYLIK